MSATLIRVSKARQFGFMNTLNTPELEFFARLAAGGGRFQFVPDYLSEYRVHSQSETSRGLRSEDLADCLEGLKAKAAAEPFKRAFMGPLLINSVSRCLQRGDRDRARHFLASKYYPEPRWKSPSTIIQTVCAGLPASMGCRLYRVIARVKAGRRSA